MNHKNNLVESENTSGTLEEWAKQLDEEFVVIEEENRNLRELLDEVS